MKALEGIRVLDLTHAGSISTRAQVAAGLPEDVPVIGVLG